MSKFKKKKGGDLPAISTASLPAIVFMLLFFFMVATVMRQNTLMIENNLPFADQVEKLEKQDLVMYIYAGKPSSNYKSTYGTEARIQLNDKSAVDSEIPAAIADVRGRKREGLTPFRTTGLTVDSDANTGLLTHIDQELHQVPAVKHADSPKKGDALQGLRK